MPLLHEIKDPINKSILCFVPNGHLTENGFEDFPGANILKSCCIWHYVNRRLASLKHTQKPFSDQEYGQVEVYFSQLNDKTNDFRHIIKLCVEELYDVFSEKVIDINQEVLINFLNTRQNQLQAHLESICAKGNISNVNVKTNYELFMEIFLRLGEIIATNKTAVNFNNRSTFDETIRMLVEPILEDIFNGIRDAYLRAILLDEIIERHKLNRDLLQKKDIDFGLVQCLSLNLNQKKINVNENKEENYKKWKAASIDILLSHGPFATVGYIGSAFYHNTQLEDCGKLGSIELLSLPAESYQKNSLGGDYSIVIVIGIHKDKVIYLDPLLESNVSGPRQAFVMDIPQFVDRIKVVNNNTLLFVTVRQNEIDTTLELMSEQTKMELPTGLYSYVYYNQGAEQPRRAVDFKVTPKIRTHRQKALIDYSRYKDFLLYSLVKVNDVTVYRRRSPYGDNIAELPELPLIELLADGTFVRHESIDNLPIDDISCFNSDLYKTIKKQMFGTYKESVTEFVGLDLSFQKLQNYLKDNACYYAANNPKLDLDTATRPMIFFSIDSDKVLKPVSVLPHVITRAILDEMIAISQGQEIVIKDCLPRPRVTSTKLHMEVIHTSTIGMFDRSPNRLELIKSQVLNSSSETFVPGSPFEASKMEFAIVDEQDHEQFKVIIEERVYYSSKVFVQNRDSPLSTILSIIFPTKERNETNQGQSPFYNFIIALVARDLYGYYTVGYRYYLSPDDLEAQHRNFIISLSGLNEKQLSDFWGILASMPEFAFEGAQSLIQNIIKWTHPKYLLDPTYDQIKELIASEKYAEALKVACEQDEKKVRANVDNSAEYTYLAANLLFDIEAAQLESLEGFNYIRRVAKGLVVREAHDKSAQISIALAGSGYNKNQYLDTIKTCLFSAGANPGGERRAVLSLINKLSGNREDVKDSLDKLEEKGFVKKHENEIVAVETFATDVISSLTAILKSDIAKQQVFDDNTKQLNYKRFKRFNSI